MALEKIFGIHAVLAAIEKNASSVEQIWLQKGQKNKKHHDIVRASELAGIRSSWVTRLELDKMVGRETVHQGVVASIHGLPVGTDNDLMQLLEQLDEIPLLLVLDGVFDPHNLRLFTHCRRRRCPWGNTAEKQGCTGQCHCSQGGLWCRRKYRIV